MKNEVYMCNLSIERIICRLHDVLNNDKIAYFDKSQYLLKLPWNIPLLYQTCWKLLESKTFNRQYRSVP